MTSESQLCKACDRPLNRKEDDYHLVSAVCMVNLRNEREILCRQLEAANERAEKAEGELKQIADFTDIMAQGAGIKPAAEWIIATWAKWGHDSDAEIEEMEATVAATRAQAREFAAFVFDYWASASAIGDDYLVVDDEGISAARLLLSCGLLESHPENENWYRWV